MSNESVIPVEKAPGPAPPLSPKSKLTAVCLEVVAIVIWFYTIAQLFVYDVDRYAVMKIAPSLEWLLAFKLPIFVTFLAILLLFLKWKPFLWRKVFYIACYPFVVLLWRIPYLILRQRSWVLGLAVLNAIISFFSSVRYNVVVTAVFLLASAIALFAANKVLLWTAVIALIVLALLSYSRKLLYVFKPAGIFRIYEMIVEALPRLRIATTQSVEGSFRGMPYEELPSEQAEKWTSSLSSSLGTTLLCLFVAKKLRDYGKSGWGKISSVFISLLLLVATVVAFTLANYALYKSDPTLFRITSVPSLSTFADYSFNRMIFDRVDELSPARGAAKLVYNAQALLVFLWGAILLSLLLSTRTERQTKELNKTIEIISQEATGMERAILTDYNFADIEEAARALEKVKEGSADFIRLLLRHV